MKTDTKKFHYRDLYRTVDGCYSSYWIGKFINSLMKQGHKKTVEKEMAELFLNIKQTTNSSPLEYFLQNVDKVKPIFKLKSVVVAGKKRDFPVYLPPQKQFKLVVRWLNNLINDRKEWYLNQRILEELKSINSSKKHSLMKQRDELFDQAVKNRFNTRYIY